VSYTLVVGRGNGADRNDQVNATATRSPSLNERVLVALGLVPLSARPNAKTLAEHLGVPTRSLAAKLAVMRDRDKLLHSYHDSYHDTYPVTWGLSAKGQDRLAQIPAASFPKAVS
jgi:hypothetical protein